MVYELKHLVNFAYQNSPYYKKLYSLAKVDLENIQLERLPIVEQTDFWASNSFQENKLLTASISKNLKSESGNILNNGVIFKSGGTTGTPKFSVYSKEEWETFTREFGWGMSRMGLQEGDLIGNLFYAGNLYASFVFIMKSLEYAEVPTIQFPIAGQCPSSEGVKFILDFGINTLVGIPSSIINIIEEAHRQGKSLPIKKIFFGGESMYLDQRARIESLYPHIYISSIGYASVDGGHLGYVTPECKYNEHFLFSNSSIMEIIDEESGEVITESGREGKLVYTNLTRKLMPIIRYPVGDRGEWTFYDSYNPHLCRYKLLGRSEEGARVGPVTICRDDLDSVFSSPIIINYPNRGTTLTLRLDIIQKQMLLEHTNHKDVLSIKLAVANYSDLKLENNLALDYFNEYLQKKLYAERPLLKNEIDRGNIWPVVIKLCAYNDLEKNPRTGKIKLVIDRR